MKDYTFKPNKVCIGRKYRYLPQLYRPISITLYSKICNFYFSEKNKIRFIKQFFRWYVKDPTGFKIKGSFTYPSINDNFTYKLSNCDIINVSCRAKKAAWKKLLSRLNFELIDYKKLKRRKYCLYFTFFFLNLDKKNKEITLDLKCNKHDVYYIFITLNSYYMNDFKLILENLKM